MQFYTLSSLYYLKESTNEDWCRIRGIHFISLGSYQLLTNYNISKINVIIDIDIHINTMVIRDEYVYYDAAKIPIELIRSLKKFVQDR